MSIAAALSVFGISLDGEWHYIIDVQKTGLNDYRNHPMRDRDTFGADRHGGPKDFYNSKGLVSDKGERKAAFGVLKNWYEKK